MSLKKRIEGIITFIGPQTRIELKAQLIDVYGMEESYLELELTKALAEMVVSLILEEHKGLFYIKETL